MKYNTEVPLLDFWHRETKWNLGKRKHWRLWNQNFSRAELSIASKVSFYKFFQPARVGHAKCPKISLVLPLFWWKKNRVMKRYKLRSGRFYIWEWHKLTESRCENVNSPLFPKYTCINKIVSYKSQKNASLASFLLVINGSLQRLCKVLARNVLCKVLERREGSKNLLQKQKNEIVLFTCIDLDRTSFICHV